MKKYSYQDYQKSVPLSDSKKKALMNNYTTKPKIKQMLKINIH